jgi:hypothetical protein
MLKYEVIKSGKKGCGKKHPVRDASLGRMSNIILSCIPLGMQKRLSQKKSTERCIPTGCKKAYTLFISHSLAFICYILLSFPLEAKRVDIEKAEKVARSYADATPQLTARRDFRLSKTVSRRVARTRPEVRSAATQPQDEPMFYVFAMNGNEGFIIVAGDDVAKPILGYSGDGMYDENNPNLVYWMETLSQEIAGAIESGTSQDEQIKAAWEAFDKDNGIAAQSPGDYVEPLMKTKWNQDTPYNYYCPAISGVRTVTGCVATAMAQIMKYHEYPTTRTAEIPGYTTITRKIKISQITESTSYRWNDMTDTDDYSTNVTITAVAELMYHCGVSVQMDYDLAANGGSGAYSHAVVPALKTYFGYDAGIAYHNRSHCTHTEWIKLLRTEIDAGRPVYYSGSNDEGGHAFVCDGYDAGNLFHINWGWGGSSDGYFEVSALNPNSAGIGGNSEGYNQSQAIITGIQPDNGGQPVVQLYLSNFTANKNLLNDLSEPFNLGIERLMNAGSATVNKVYLGVLLHTQGNALHHEYDKESIDLNLPPNAYLPYITMDSCLLPSNLSPGTYKLYPVYSASEMGTPVIISGEKGKRYITITVQNDGKAILSSGNSEEPNLWLESLQTTSNLYQDRTGNFQVEIYNTGTVDYNSGISLQLGEQMVATGKVRIQAGHTETFYLSGKITVSPGNYSLSVRYDPDNTPNGTPSELLGSSEKVTVNEISQFVPNAPTLAYKTATSITLNAPDESVEYSKDDINWQDSPVFDGLAPNTGYTFYARYKGMDVPSEPSETFTTDKAVLSGTVTISGTAKFGETLSAETSTLKSEPEITNLGTVSYQWKRNGNDISGATGSTYTLVQADIATTITVTVSTDETLGEVVSAATDIVELSSLWVNGAPVSIVNNQLDYQATCDDVSVKLETGQSIDIPVTLIASVNGVDYNSGQNIPLHREKEVTEINISIVSGDKKTTNNYKLMVANWLDASGFLFKRWDNVVAVNTNSANNGNNIDGVRWYIDGETEVPETWYIQTTGGYRAEINIAGRWHHVCGSPKIRDGRLIAYPNPVSIGENLTLQLPDSFMGGYMDVISLAGSTVKQKLPVSGMFETIVVADWAPGIYLLNIVAPDGDRKIIKIAVGY